MAIALTLEETTSRVRAALERDAAGLGLDAAALELRYVLNWGGFVNTSFQVSDGVRTLHLKLAGEAEQIGKLARWRQQRAPLEERYAAPRMLGWLEVAGTPLQGPVFESVAGTHPRSLTPALLARLSVVLHALHGDDGLARRLGGEARICRDTFREFYLERFAGDLEMIAATPPPFVSSARLQWMQDQARALAAEAEASDAFSDQARSAIHGDLWLDNLLVDGDGHCWLLDWDDLAVGDPAADWAMLLGPTADDLTPLRLDDVPEGVAMDAAMHERLRLYARASLLDWVIDPLADYLDADAAPEHAESVREEKRRVHEAALERYHQLYPSG
jgi:aminoglycoside phosphotransferase (APT) family kinase protein